MHRQVALDLILYFQASYPLLSRSIRWRGGLNVLEPLSSISRQTLLFNQLIEWFRVGCVLNIVWAFVHPLSLKRCIFTWPVFWDLLIEGLEFRVLLVSKLGQKEQVFALLFREEMRAFWVEGRQSTYSWLVHVGRILHRVVTQNAVNRGLIGHIRGGQLLLTVIVLNMGVDRAEFFWVRAKKILLFEHLFWLLLFLLYL